MAVEVEVTGNGHFAGAKSNVTTYTVSEESTPVEASDSSGATGQINFTAVDDPSRLGSALLLGDTVELVDGDRGSITGRINSLSGNTGMVTVAADTVLNRLIMDATAAWFSGTFGNAMLYYLGLAGIDSGVIIDETVASKSIIVPGWTGDVWTKVKELCVVADAEITVLKDVIVVRPVRQNNINVLNNVDISWGIENREMARQVEVNYYNTVIRNGALVYPQGGWSDDVQIYSADAGETVTYNLPVNISLTSLVQPVVQDYVSQSTSNASVYAVIGSDSKPITAAQWKANKGALSVAIGEDGTSIDLTITGAVGPSAKYAPYRIAVSSSSGNDYSSLRILGTGAWYEQKTLTVPTGVSESETPRDVGVTVDNIFVRTLADARDIAANVAAKWSAPTRTVTFSKQALADPSEIDTSYNYATFGDFDDYAVSESIVTFGDFDAEWAGKTYADFDEFWREKVENEFKFQAFGNVGGSRVQFRRAIYRIRSASITESSVNYTAEADTTFADFDESAAGMTFADFDALYEGMTFADFSLIPLPKVAPEYDR